MRIFPFKSFAICMLIVAMKCETAPAPDQFDAANVGQISLSPVEAKQIKSELQYINRSFLMFTSYMEKIRALAKFTGIDRKLALLEIHYDLLTFLANVHNEYDVKIARALMVYLK